MIVCGWCGRGTAGTGPCESCGRDPRLPYSQRGQDPPDAHAVALARAEADLRREGKRPTTEAIAERLGVDTRTVQRWRKSSPHVTPVP